MDELDNQAAIAELDRQIAEAEMDTRERVARHADDEDFARREWERFSLSVQPLRQQRELIVMTLARVKSFEVPSPMIVTSTPH